MRMTRKQLEENYAEAVKQKDLHYIALAETLKLRPVSYSRNGVWLKVVGMTRADGGIVIDMSAGYPSLSYLDELDLRMQTNTGVEKWATYRTLIDKIKNDRERMLDVKHFVEA